MKNTTAAVIVGGIGLATIGGIILWKRRAAAKEFVYDLNGDGLVNVIEMSMVSDHWGETGAPGWIPEDINQDGVIDQADIDLLQAHWTG